MEPESAALSSDESASKRLRLQVIRPLSLPLFRQMTSKVTRQETGFWMAQQLNRSGTAFRSGIRLALDQGYVRRPNLNL